jgi:hypothetical protein
VDLFDWTSVTVVASAWLSLVWWAITSPQEWPQLASFAYTWFVEKLKPHAHAIITLASLSFGLWKWFRSRESELYRRLGLAISREEQNFRMARNGIATILTAPGPAVSITVPLFAAGPLGRILAKSNWQRMLTVRKLPSDTDKSLMDAIGLLVKIEDNAKRRLSFVREQLGAAHMLLGALDSGRAGFIKDTAPPDRLAERTRLNDEARGHFQDAMKIEGLQDDPDLIFLAAHQLLKTNDVAQAMALFQRLANFADANLSSQAQQVLTMRSHVGQALCEKQLGRLNPANDMLIAIANAIAMQSPLRGRHLLEQAAMHELHAQIRLLLNFNGVRAHSLQKARTDYNTVLAQLEKRKVRLPSRLMSRLRSWFFRQHQQLWVGNRLREMRSIASAGQQRVLAAVAQANLPAPSAVQTTAVSLKANPAL